MLASTLRHSVEILAIRETMSRDGAIGVNFGRIFNIVNPNKTGMKDIGVVQTLLPYLDHSKPLRLSTSAFSVILEPLFRLFSNEPFGTTRPRFMDE